MTRPYEASTKSERTALFVALSSRGLSTRRANPALHLTPPRRA